MDKRKRLIDEIFDLENGIINLQQRATGRSTRLIDKYIQDLFGAPDRWIPIYDHFKGKMAARILVDHIKRRLSYEHNLEICVKSIENGFAIRLKNYHHPDFSEEIARMEKDLLELRKEFIEKLKFKI